MTKRPTWRPVGNTGDAYPDWMRDLLHSSGVYAIRVPGFIRSHVVVYVGESHSGRLAKTIARHFQSWTRSKGWWSGLFGTGADPGRTYSRGDVEVLVVTCPASRAIALQNKWIRELEPRDNILGQVEEEVPF
jgi:hypothetical protein